MSRIRKLAPDVTGKIAAGEVVERPASIVKELVENALDASSKRIDLQVSNGGKTLVRLDDDGDGISNGDLPLAVQNYSTSKIKEAADIMNVRTLGFRGEALASIRSVCRLTIRSKSKTDDIGREMQWEGDRIVKDAPFVRNNGTEIVASDLFHSFPARRKFLSSDPAELRRIISLIRSFSLSFPSTSFSMKGEDKEIVSYPASHLEERVEAVYGADTYPSLIRFHDWAGRLSLHGFISQPNMTRGNRSLQYIFVNNRHIKDRLLSHAIGQAYKSLIPGGRFPLFVLFFEIPPEEIDVNVHPAKSEIRFRNEREIHRFVSTTLRKYLSGGEMSFSEKVESVYRDIFPHRGGSTDSGMEYIGESTQPGSVARRDETDIGDSRQELNFVLKETPMSLFEGNQDDRMATSGKLYWQLHQSYILIQIRGGMVIIDQHAAHERILFNEANRSLEGAAPAVQPLLFPATLDLTPEEYARYEEISDMIDKLGFEIEPFGLRSIIVRGIPAGLKNWNDGQLLQEILGERWEGKDPVTDLLKTFACRASIKAGDKLSVEEMESITDQLFATEFPFTCPHGRPTMLRVGLAELKRRFKRTASKEK